MKWVSLIVGVAALSVAIGTAIYFKTQVDDLRKQVAATSASHKSIAGIVEKNTKIHWSSDSGIAIGQVFCPKGTYVSGGGADGYSGAGTYYTSSPNGNGWLAILNLAYGPSAADANNPTTLHTYALCLKG